MTTIDTDADAESSEVEVESEAPPAVEPDDGIVGDGSGRAVPESPRTDLLLTLAGVFVVFSLVVFFAIEMTNPDAYVLQDRTIYILLGLIAALLGLNQFHAPTGGHGG